MDRCDETGGGAGLLGGSGATLLLPAGTTAASRGAATAARRVLATGFAGAPRKAQTPRPLSIPATSTALAHARERPVCSPERAADNATAGDGAATVAL